MSNLVIVAIPDENDRVWKVSSEKKPHLTLLFLGDADKVDNADQITQFVEHAANTTLQRFYLPVDRRGELGEDKADVLFFRKGRWGYKDIRDFRVQLLKDNNIRKAYDAAGQFEGPWNPHLTLGYPETPAKADDTDRDFGFYDVAFNKIAVWFGDFDGPEFLLKDWFDEWEAMEATPMDVAMSDTSELGEAHILEHYGVRGMRWGVRKEETKGDPGTAKRWFDPEGHDLVTDIAKNFVLGSTGVFAPLAIPSAVRLNVGAYRGVKAKVQDLVEKHDDKKFEKVAKSQEGFAAIHNGAVDRFNSDVQKINQKYTEADLVKPAKKKAYDAEILKSMQDSYKDSANKIGNKRGTKHLDVEFHNDGMDFSIKVKEGQQKPTVEKVQHAYIDDDDTVTFAGQIKRAATGHILGFEFEDFKPNPMIHNAELGAEFMVFNGMMDPDEFLEHHGVKGMHWGVRKEGEATSKPIEGTFGGGLGLTRRSLKKYTGSAFLPGNSSVKVAVFGPFSLLDSKVRVDLKEASRQVKVGKADKKWEKGLQDGSAYVAVQNHLAEHFNSKIDGVNSKYPPDRDWSKEDYNSPKDPEFKKYVKEVHTLTKESIDHAVSQLNLDSPSGTKEVKVEQDSNDPLTFKMTVHDKEAKHAAEDNPEIAFKVAYKTTTKGRVIGFKLDDGFASDIAEVDTMAQSMDNGAHFLAAMGIIGENEIEHYGVKGMHWGVRKPPPDAVVTSAVSRVPHGKKRKTKIEVEGGENHPAHEDAIEVAEVRAKLKKSGTVALSNADLQKLNKRLQLETQAAQLTSNRGQKFIQRQLEQTGQQTVQAGRANVARKIVRKGGKAAGVAALLV